LAPVLRKEFSRLGDKVVEGNIADARAGFDFAREHGKRKLLRRLKPLPDIKKRMLLNGNEALALGAMVGGCKFISGYPMTPASPVMEYMADKGRKYNVVAVHVEDEIAAINMAAGAAYTGVRAIVAFTQSGSTARRVSKYRPRVPVLAITPSDTVSGRLLLHWGVYPFQIAAAASVDELFAAGARLARESGLAKPDDLVVITGGVPVGVAGSTNLLKVERIV
ncbi:pyruvate kinase alpha/beta domain-containing protein, partial [Chloroflexota bacterium]